ncbi:hypothetical protein [Cryobacterium sp. Y50]|uniref:hypothetical protein n=1 Tax=Cryobacterium sp. Y50 TaxID=2048286 RepID=UPI000CE4DD33|nr:hypothetical protein [Cryobacterium sp. Y50]
MEISPEVQALAISLAGSAIRNTAQGVSDRVKGLRAGNNDSETINGLEQLVNDLISDKNDLTRIAQAYQAELVAQRLSSGDVQYITETVVPLVEKLMGFSQNDDSDKSHVIEAIKPLLSIETVNVLQLLGFNFRKAIGEPLTELVERAILSKAPGDASVLIQRLQLEREVGYIAVAQDPAAHARLVAIFGN